jgi:alpha-glucosidase (family GH31 glycosyl hydrolase)
MRSPLAALYALSMHIIICSVYQHRHMCLHYGYDDAVWELGEQYLVGTQLLVAPVLHEGATGVDVYFPRLSGSWVHIVS